MTKLTDTTKQMRVTSALFDLAVEYRNEGRLDTARLLAKAAIDLPDDSKVRLYNILVKEG